jgi:hypothetical protein
MNRFQKIFDAQKAYFASNVSRSHTWRVEQLDRIAEMIKENETALQHAIARDFKTATQEYIFETAATYSETDYKKSQLQSWMTPTEAPVPKALAKTGHKGVIYRDPYGVVLVIGPSRHRCAGIHPGDRYSGGFTVAVAPGCSAARLHFGRNGFNRRGWHFRWDFSHWHPCGSAGRSLSARPAGDASQPSGRSVGVRMGLPLTGQWTKRLANKLTTFILAAVANTNVRRSRSVPRRR